MGRRPWMIAWSGVRSKAISNPCVRHSPIGLIRSDAPRVSPESGGIRGQLCHPISPATARSALGATTPTKSHSACVSPAPTPKTAAEGPIPALREAAVSRPGRSAGSASQHSEPLTREQVVRPAPQTLALSEVIAAQVPAPLHQVHDALGAEPAPCRTSSCRRGSARCLRRDPGTIEQLFGICACAPRPEVTSGRGSSPCSAPPC